MFNKKFFYGRLKSRGLSKSKKFYYDNYKNNYLLDFEKINLIKNKNFILEIGFGLGENLIFQSEKYNEDIFIGVDPFINGIANVIYEARLKNLNNIYLVNSPIQSILDKFKNNFFSKIFILFPDPWMKKKHNKRRLINNLFLKEILKKMKIQSSLIFVTDDKNYFENVINLIIELKVEKSSFHYSLDNRYEIKDTKYFNKASNLKKEIYFLNLDKLKNVT